MGVLAREEARGGMPMACMQRKRDLRQALEEARAAYSGKYYGAIAGT